MTPGIRALVLSGSCFVVAATGLVLRAQEKPANSPNPPVSFNREILPILSNNCFACHGPDEKARKTRFHFDTEDGAFTKRGIIVPGNAAESALVEHITSEDPDEHMPPPESGKTLTQKQIDLLRRWIDQGAKWDKHWAYVPPKRSELPTTRSPEWVRNPIDQFVRARLDREGLEPSPEADKETILRRVTYDLTGLPPTPAEVDAFLADRSPDAYEKRGGRACCSRRTTANAWRCRGSTPARYADTHGYHIDSHREMWPWRDWVIDAFNTNLPFDQFTIDQIAGDLLPNATRDQKHRDRIQPQPHDQLRRRRHRRRVSSRIRRRSRGDDDERLAGTDDGLRTVPRSQVRSDHAEGVLPASSRSSTPSLKRDSTAAPATRRQ